MVDFSTISHIHIIGAGGIGLSAVAKLLQQEGKTVTGSDARATGVTEDLVARGIPMAIGQVTENVPERCDIVLYSGAVPPSNPEREEAQRRGIPQLSYFDFIGEFSRTKRTVAVTGTNGKSSTTAMLGLMLIDAGLDPTVIVGSKVPGFPDENLRRGESDLFVVEACEHEANMLKIGAQTIVLTNIEEDHLDFYRDLTHITETFQRFVDSLPEDGLLVLNADDHVSRRDITRHARTVTYAQESRADYEASGSQIGDGVQTFTVTKSKEKFGEFSLHVPGAFNVANAMAAATAAMELGASPESIKRTLSEYRGIWRRFEKVEEINGATVISDYGHHPTAVAATMRATREFFPSRRIVLVFQPHQHNRTKKLFDEFVASFDAADLVILPEIFDVAGRKDDDDAHMSSRDLVDAVKKRDGERGVVRGVHFTDSVDAGEVLLRKLVTPDDVVLLMGAGDIYLIAEKRK